MYFKDLLALDNVDPTRVLAVRHNLEGSSPKLNRLLPWLVENEPELFNAVQSWQHNPLAETAFKNVDYIAAFLGLKPKLATFVGIYKRGTYIPLSKAQCKKHPPVIKLVKYGAEEEAFTSPREGLLLFDLKLTQIASEYQGKLTISWPGDRNYYQYVEKKNLASPRFFVDAILEKSAFGDPEEMPEWRKLGLSWQELKRLPDRWRQSLAEWRGVYLIFDVSDGKSYVGAAYGKDNLLGRWMNYRVTGHGGNKELRKRNPENFRFSILERVSPDAIAEDVQKLESTWKDRLHTRDHGMNEN